MGYPIYHSQYTAAQIEASIGKTPRIKAATRTWEIWDIATSQYVDTGVSIDTELFIDPTLTEPGYAADAAVTGVVRQNVAELNAYDALIGVASRNSGTHNGITFTWTGNVCTISGTSTDYAVNFLVAKSDIPYGLVPGQTYMLKYSTTNNDVYLRIMFYDSEDTASARYVTSDRDVLVPAGTVKWSWSLYIGPDKTFDPAATVSDIHLFNAASNLQLTEDAAVVRENILLKYTGTAPTESITELPDNSWWLVSGSILKNLVGTNFFWLDKLGDNTSYIVNVFRVASTMRRFEIRGAGTFLFWAGYILQNQSEITWLSTYPDTTLTEHRVPADAKTVGDNILLKYTGTAPATSITELPDNSWWVALGEILQPLLGPGFVWALNSSSNYVVKKIIVSSVIKRFEICHIGGTFLWAGYATTGDVIWGTTMPDVVENSETIMITKKNNVQAGITWEWQTDGSCKVWGTATDVSIDNIIPGEDLPSFLNPTDRIVHSRIIQQLIPGDKVEFKYKTTNNDVYISVFWSDGSNTTFDTIKNGYGVLTVPQNKTRWGVRLCVASGTVIPATDPAVISDIHITKFCEDVATGGGTLNAKFIGFGQSTMSGAVWVLPSGSSTPVYSHLCPYDDAPYAGIASGLGVRQENVNYTLMSDTTFMSDSDEQIDGYNCIKNYVQRIDLQPYDYVQLYIGSRDLRTCPLGNLDSVASDGSVVGGVLEVLDYIRNNPSGNPLCTPIICSSSPFVHPIEGYDVFTTPMQGPSGAVTLADLDAVMHQLAEREHFIYLDFQDMWLSYHWFEFTPTPANLHLASDRAYRVISEYLRRKVVG